MRVRTTKPTKQDVLDWWNGDAIEVAAKLTGVTPLGFLTHYLSKVGTWRDMMKRMPDCFTPNGNKIVLDLDVQSEWYDIIYKGLEGAPEWLREEYIMRLSDAIDEGDVLAIGEGFSWTRDAKRLELP